MSTSTSSDEVKTSPTEAVGGVDAVDTVPQTLKVASTKNGDIILVPQPSDDPEDPLVSPPDPIDAYLRERMSLIASPTHRTGRCARRLSSSPVSV